MASMNGLLACFIRVFPFPAASLWNRRKWELPHCLHVLQTAHRVGVLFDIVPGAVSLEGWINLTGPWGQTSMTSNASISSSPESPESWTGGSGVWCVLNRISAVCAKKYVFSLELFELLLFFPQNCEIKVIIFSSIDVGEQCDCKCHLRCNCCIRIYVPKQGPPLIHLFHLLWLCLCCTNIQQIWAQI